MTTAKELSDHITKAMEGVPMTKNGVSTASALADAERRAESAEAKLANRWLDIDEQATSGERILLLWKPFGGMKEHVELGRFSQSATGWVNTYGKPFGSAPDKYAALAPFDTEAKLAKAEKRLDLMRTQRDHLHIEASGYIAKLAEAVKVMEQVTPWLVNGDYDTRGGMSEMSRLGSVCAGFLASMKGGE
ncbi:MAG TPA: hypothetical protein VGC14_25235 [Rhizobium sp.]